MELYELGIVPLLGAVVLGMFLVFWGARLYGKRSQGKRRAAVLALSCGGLAIAAGAGLMLLKNAPQSVSAWTFPVPSSFFVIPADQFVLNTGDGHATLGGVNRRLRTILMKGGYDEVSYYSADGGFVLVTRIEEFLDDGRRSPRYYATDETSSPVFDIGSYAKALIFAPKGRYRVFVFAITDRPLNMTSRDVKKDEARNWIKLGANVLPTEIEDAPLKKRTNCTVMVFEFLNGASPSLPKLVQEAAMPIRIQLLASNIGEFAQ